MIVTILAFLFVLAFSITIHEFGHFLGFDHSDDPDSIMYYPTDTNRKLTSFMEFL